MKKIFINILSIITVLSVIASTSAAAFASDDKQLLQAPDSNSTEHKIELQELQQDVENYLEEVAPRIGGRRLLSVPLYKQINSYYCGPTSVRMTLSYLGVSKTQAQLASQMGTTSSQGTYVYQVRNCLNSHLGSGTYKYVLTSQIAFSTGLRYSIDKSKPVICHVMTGALPHYSGYNTGHYVVAKGYYWGSQGSSGASRVQYNDPNYNSKYYGSREATWGQMNQAINNNAGYYIMAS